MPPDQLSLNVYHPRSPLDGRFIRARVRADEARWLRGSLSLAEPHPTLEQLVEPFALNGNGIIPSCGCASIKSDPGFRAEHLRLEASFYCDYFRANESRSLPKPLR